MGINIDGARDLVSAGDGSLTIEGFSLNTSGIATFTGGVNVGTAASIYSNGNVSAGIVTATELVVGSAVTIGRTNGNAAFAGIVTATEFVVGAAVTIGRTNGNATFAGIVTATAFVDDGTNLLTEINTKATTGKAIAMAMIFG
tara:strand:+ start:39 stop:467 length:429 start_codon:yes stop_codon:yes gene_type:complete